MKSCLEINGLQHKCKDAHSGILALCAFWIIATLSITHFLIKANFSVGFIVFMIAVTTGCFLPQFFYIRQQTRVLRETLSILNHPDSKPNIKTCSDVQLVIVYACAGRMKSKELDRDLVREMETRGLLGPSGAGSTLFFHRQGRHGANARLPVRFAEQFLFIEPLNPYHKPVMIKKQDINLITTTSDFSYSTLKKEKMIVIKYGTRNKQIKIIPDKHEELVGFIKQHYSVK